MGAYCWERSVSALNDPFLGMTFFRADLWSHAMRWDSDVAMGYISSA